MKKFPILLALLLSLNVSNASFVLSKEKALTAQNEKSAPGLAEKNITNEAENGGTKALQQRALMEKVVKMSVKDYEALSGKKMNFTERLAFKITKKRFQKKLEMADGSSSSGFNIGGFALGFFLGLIGVLIAYLFIKDDNLRKWAWIGVGTIVAIALLAAVL